MIDVATPDQPAANLFRSQHLYHRIEDAPGLAVCATGKSVEKERPGFRVAVNGSVRFRQQRHYCHTVWLELSDLKVTERRSSLAYAPCERSSQQLGVVKPRRCDAIEFGKQVLPDEGVGLAPYPFV